MALTNASRLADFGTGIGTQGAILKVDNADQMVGIGTTDPTSKLEVKGDFKVSAASTLSGAVKISDSTNSTSTTTGALIVTGGVGIGASLHVDGDVSIGGTLTYEDVTNIDSVGLLTARSGLRVTAGGVVVTAGVSTFASRMNVNSTIEANEGINVTAGIVTFTDTGTATYGVDIVNSSAGSSGLRIKAGNADGQYSLLVEDKDGTNLFEVMAGGGGANLRSGSLYIPDKIIHYGDTNTAIRFPSADTISLETGGTERARVTSTGAICVSHTNALHSGNLQVSTSGSDAIDVNAYSSTAANGGRLTFYRSKNASIGSNTIVADNDSLGRIDFRGYNSNGNAYNIGATIEAEVDGAVDSSTDMPSALTFGTSADGSSSPTERLRITSAGDVGIGNDGSFPIYTDSGDTNLILGSGSDDAAIQLHSGTDKYGGLYFGDTTSGGDRYVGYVEYKHDDNFLRFATAGGERVRIDSNGYLSFAGDTNTYISHPSADQLAITVAGGSFPIARFGTGGGGSTVGLSTSITMVTNAEKLAVRGYSSFKSTSKDYAAIYLGSEGNTTDSANALLLFNQGGANRGGIGYVPNTGELRFNNQYFITFNTGASSLNGTERLRIKSDGNVDIGGGTHSRNLTVHAATNSVILIEGGSSGTSNLMFGDENDEDVGMLGYNHASNYLAFTVNTAERLKIASNGAITSTYPTVTTYVDTAVDETTGSRFIITLPDNSRMFRIQGSFSFAGTETFRIWGDFGDWSDSHSAALEGFANWWEEGAAGPTYQDNISGRYFEVADPCDSQCSEVTYDIVVTTMAFFNGGSENQGGGRPGVSGTIRWTRSQEGNAFTIFSYQDTSAKATDRLETFAWDIDGVSGTPTNGKHQYTVQALPITGDAQNLGDAA